ncbi:MAG: steroid 3-ketoacyl-CoA thiolase, partial [Deltaproteobacteria bacterium]|nr:steroid 3-ketoacyl-CoA thiolase [Deltaproteobacteria bacterium]
MAEAVIVEALRTPIARGKQIKGDLSGVHAASLLALSQDAVVKKAGLKPEDVEQIISWQVGATTIDTQCGSAQQANHLISALIKGGSIDVGIACGSESMSRVGMGMNVMNGPGFFQTPDWPWDSTPDQFASAERLAKDRGITREEADQLGFDSQAKAIAAWDAGHFDREVFAVEAPVLGEDGQPTGETKTVTKDQGLRATTLEGLAGLRTVKEDGIHSAGNSSQISDGSAAVLWMSADKAKSMGLKPRARIISDVVVGTDP